MELKTLELISTIFSGGMFVTLLVIVWKGATFVQWVRSAFTENTQGHLRIEIAIGKVDHKVDDVATRVTDVEREMNRKNGG